MVHSLGKTLNVACMAIHSSKSTMTAYGMCTGTPFSSGMWPHPAVGKGYILTLQQKDDEMFHDTALHYWPI